MRIERRIVPECYVDTKITEILGQSSKNHNHQHGCGDVARELKTSLANEIALGIVDEDLHKGQSAKYFIDFFKEIKRENNLVLKKHSSLEQYLILVCPEIEKWLLENARLANILPEDYHLPGNLRRFTQISKIKNIDKNEDFYRFIKALVRNEAPGIVTLKNWLALFAENKLMEIV